MTETRVQTHSAAAPPQTRSPLVRALAGLGPCTCSGTAATPRVMDAAGSANASVLATVLGLLAQVAPILAALSACQLFARTDAVGPMGVEG